MSFFKSNIPSHIIHIYSRNLIFSLEKKRANKQKQHSKIIEIERGRMGNKKDNTRGSCYTKVNFCKANNTIY